MATLTPQLENRLRESEPGDLIDVIVEVGGASAPCDGPRETAVRAQQSLFQSETEHLERAVQEAGGQVIGRTWLARSLKARLPAGRVRDLLRAAGVSVLDLPRRLQRG